ncbi:Ubiquitin carboxyl-terminal hydrolase 31 [Sarracenia purpurea var. burkii]
MSELITNTNLTPTQNESVPNGQEIIAIADSEVKLKRTFSLKKCCSNGGTRVSKRKSKYIDSSTIPERVQTKSSAKKLNILNSNSINKLITKVVHKMTNFNLNSKNSLYNSYDCADSKQNNMLSLSSSDIYNDDARVPPIIPTFIKGDKVPGVIGLRNHGNTCFINAILQCLSHTDILAEYFVLDQYKVDLCRRNKLNSKKYGTKGEVTEQLAVLLKSIWSCQYNPEISNQFKVVVDKYGSQYRGNNQHDAQEFLLWLLDKVHEDLNTATKKKYKTIKNSFGRPDVVAAETLANHVRCNNSFVHAVFQAQFCSSVTCPRCDRQSNTFDPFLCVSVPVPQNHIGIYVTVLYTSQQPRQVKLGLMLPINDEIKDLRKLLSSYTGISERNNTPVNTIRETDSVYCLELPNTRDPPDESEAYLLLCWVNLLVVENNCTRFGSPFTMPISRETSYVDLQKLLLKEMAWMLHDDVLTTDQEIPLFRIRVADTADAPELSYLDPTVDHPLFTEPVEHALAIGLFTNTGPAHLKLILEWDLQAKESTIADDTDQVEEHSSVKQLKLTTEQGMTVTLEECFKLYTKAEVLAAEDAWHCPNCNLKQEVIKQLGLWTLPDILVVHMKRFKQNSTRNPSNSPRMPVKLSTLVDFPLYGFDLTPHLAPGYRGSSPPSLWSPWKRPSACKQSLKRESNAYDLYAVCNHHGQDLQSGHYTGWSHCSF